jgi:hypothetical protein
VGLGSGDGQCRLFRGLGRLLGNSCRMAAADPARSLASGGLVRLGMPPGSSDYGSEHQESSPPCLKDPPARSARPGRHCRPLLTYPTSAAPFFQLSGGQMCTHFSAPSPFINVLHRRLSSLTARLECGAEPCGQGAWISPAGHWRYRETHCILEVAA